MNSYESLLQRSHLKQLISRQPLLKSVQKVWTDLLQVFCGVTPLIEARCLHLQGLAVQGTFLCHFALNPATCCYNPTQKSLITAPISTTSQQIQSNHYHKSQSYDARRVPTRLRVMNLVDCKKKNNQETMRLILAISSFRWLLCNRLS